LLFSFSDSVLAEKLRQASPHWLRHTHATDAVAGGASITTVRNNLRQASVSTISNRLHTDGSKRASELISAFNSKS
jgi:site-specific recombinase XerD